MADITPRKVSITVDCDVIKLSELTRLKEELKAVNGQINAYKILTKNLQPGAGLGGGMGAGSVINPTVNFDVGNLTQKIETAIATGFANVKWPEKPPPKPRSPASGPQTPGAAALDTSREALVNQRLSQAAVRNANALKNNTKAELLMTQAADIAKKINVIAKPGSAAIPGSLNAFGGEGIKDYVNTLFEPLHNNLKQIIGYRQTFTSQSNPNKKVKELLERDLETGDVTLRKFTRPDTSGNARLRESIKLTKELKEAEDDLWASWRKADKASWAKTGTPLRTQLGSQLTGRPSTDKQVQTNTKDMLTSITHVAQWAAAVAVLYKGLALAQFSMSSLLTVGRQTAVLEQIFKKVGGTVRELRDDVLGLAVEYGRSSKEAMDSAIAFSRLGLSRKAVNEAVRVSLLAANVAELSVAESTEYLLSLMQQYQLSVFDLSSELAGLNEISNNYNVTNKDMLIGISRTAAIAKQAGLPLSELKGILGAVIGQTKQSGANIGNSIKSIITAIGNPAIQDLLRSYNVEVKTGNGQELKDLSTILNDVYLAYNKMISADKQWLLYKAAGKTQSSRMQALLDSYVTSQRLAIQSQLNMNSAEDENKKIMATLSAQLQALASAWERFVNIQGNRGVIQFLSAFTTMFKDLLQAFNGPKMSIVGTLITGLFLGVAARAAVATVWLARLSKEGGVFNNTAAHMKKALSEVWQALAQSQKSTLAIVGSLGKTGKAIEDNVGKFNQYGSTLITTGKQSNAAATAANKTAFSLKGLGTSAAGAAITGLSVFGTAAIEVVIVMAAMYAVMKTISWVITLISGTSSDASDEMDRLGKSSTEASKAASAYMQTVKLISTIQKQLKNPKLSSDERKRINENMEALGIDVNNLEEEKKKKKLQAYQSNARALKDKQDELALAIKERDKAITSSNKEGVKSANDKIAEIQQKQVNILEEKEGLDEAQRENSLEVLKILEQQKQTLEEIKNLYDSFDTAGPGKSGNFITEYFKEIALQKELQNQIDANESSLKSGMMSQDMIDAKMSSINKSKDFYTQMYPTEREIKDETLKYWLSGRNSKSKIFGIKELMSNVEGKLANLEIMSADVTDKTPVPLLSNKQIEEIQKKINDSKARQSAARPSFDNLASNIASEYAQANVDSMVLGANQLEKLISRGNAVEKLIQQTRKISTVGSEGDKIAANAMLSRYATIAERNVNDIRKQGLEILTKENSLLGERNKKMREAIMGAGPGDMLKLMAASRASQRGVGIGGFMAMDTDMRQKMGVVDPRYSSEGMELGAERRQYESIFGKIQELGIQDVKAQMQTIVNSWTEQMQYASEIKTAASTFGMHVDKFGLHVDKLSTPGQSSPLPKGTAPGR